MISFKQFLTPLLLAIASLSAVMDSFAKDRPYLTDRIHDTERPRPARVIPGSTLLTPPPSDAIVLFDGSNLDAWKGDFLIDNGIMTATKGGLSSKQIFGDIQLHLEWRAKDSLKPNGQKGANSGVYLMGRYEVQIQQSFVNTTYADGQAAALYGQYPPLVNAATPQGNWNSYDIIFTAPVYNDQGMQQKAAVTVIHNGVVVQHHQNFEGPTVHKKIASYPASHPAKGPIYLQYHGDPMEFRNIWVRDLEERTKAPEDEVANWKPLFEGSLGKDYSVSGFPEEQFSDIVTMTDNSLEILYKWPHTKAPFGLISTTKEYSHFNLELEYKWGERKFAPRLEKKRDAGILFHTKQDGKFWPFSLECQIQEGDTGDLWVIQGPKVNAILKNGEKKVIDSGGEKSYLSSVKYHTYEREGWNHVRVEVRGDKLARFFVNGHLVNELRDFKDKEGKPLSKGFIGLQVEGAELTYRNVRIQEL